MKRFRRILFNTLTVISLLLALATAGLWVRSRSEINSIASVRVFENSHGEMAEHELAVSLEPGTVQIYGSSRLSLTDIREPGVFWTHERIVFRETGYRPSSTRWIPRYFENFDGSTQFLFIPLWLPFTAFLVLPATRAFTAHRRRQRGPGHCPACGYDMRANPARCSECGHEPMRPATPR